MPPDPPSILLLLCFSISLPINYSFFPTAAADYNPTYVANPTKAIKRTFSPTRTELEMLADVATVTATFDITVDTTPEGCECFFLDLEGTRRVFILTPVVSVCIFDVSGEFSSDYTIYRHSMVYGCYSYYLCNTQLIL